MALLAGLIGALLAAGSPAAAAPKKRRGRSRVALLSLESIPADARVKINGRDLGGLPLKLSLAPGRYLIEVLKPGYAEWRRWIDAVAGQKLEIEAKLVARKAGASSKPQPSPATRQTRPSKPQAGGAKAQPASRPATTMLLVASDVLYAVVYVDGRKVGQVPVLIRDLAPGKHRVELRAKGYARQRREVQLGSGQTLKLSVGLRAGKEGGTLRVLASPLGTIVSVDGTRRGQAPVEITGVDPGTHVVEGRADGYRTGRSSIEVQKGKVATVKLELQELPPVVRTGALRVVTERTARAMVFIDGKLAGKTPLLKKGVVTGPHVVKVRRKGYREQLATVRVAPGETAELRAKLEPAVAGAEGQKEGGEPKAEKPPASRPAKGGLETEKRTSFSYGSQLVQPLTAAGDVEVGFPYLFGARASTGIFDLGDLGMDGLIGIRTYGAVTEAWGRLRLRVIRFGPWAVATETRFGGGGGPDHRNTFFFAVGASGSVYIRRRLNLTLGLLMKIYSDRQCPVVAQSNEQAACTLPPPGVNAREVRNRFVGLRGLLRAAVEVPILEWLTGYAAMTFAPFQGNRRSFSDPFAGIMPDSDPGVYGVAGVTMRR